MNINGFVAFNFTYNCQSHVKLASHHGNNLMKELEAGFELSKEITCRRESCFHANSCLQRKTHQDINSTNLIRRRIKTRTLHEQILFLDNRMVLKKRFIIVKLFMGLNCQSQ